MLPIFTLIYRCKLPRMQIPHRRDLVVYGQPGSIQLQRSSKSSVHAELYRAIPTLIGLLAVREHCSSFCVPSGHPSVLTQDRSRVNLAHGMEPAICSHFRAA
jgi:hypothetical protein